MSVTLLALALHRTLRLRTHVSSALVLGLLIGTVLLDVVRHG